MSGMIGSLGTVMRHAEEDLGQTEEPKRFQQLMGVNHVSEILHWMRIAIWRTAQVIKAYEP